MHIKDCFGRIIGIAGIGLSLLAGTAFGQYASVMATEEYVNKKVGSATNLVWKAVETNSSEIITLRSVADDAQATADAAKTQADFTAQNLATNYYTKEQTDDAIDAMAAYYITADAQGNAFTNYTALTNATVYYSGGVVRVPTRNDYAVVLADETHGGSEWRYIYAVAQGETNGQWEAQYPIETNDYEALANKPAINGHNLTNDLTGADLGLLDKSDVVAPSPSASVGQAADAKATGDALEPLLFAQYYPEGNVKSAAEFTAGIKYDFDSINRTATVKPFCNTGTAANDNSSLAGRVVLPPFVDAQDNPYISDDGTRFKVVGVAGGSATAHQSALTAIVAPITVMSIGVYAFERCASLASVFLPAATDIGDYAFVRCTSLASVSLPAVTSIGKNAFERCASLASVSLPAATDIGDHAFLSCTSLASISLPAVTSIGKNAFENCTSLTSVSLPAAESIGNYAFASCTSLISVSLPAATDAGYYVFYGCTSLASVDFGAILSSVPTLGTNAFFNVPTSCKIIVPDSLYDAWIAASRWSTLYASGYKFLKHSEWEFARRYEKADKVSDASDGDIASLDANGNLNLSGMNRDANGNLNATEFTYTQSQVADYDSAAVGTTINKANTPVVLHSGAYWLVRKSFVKTSSGWSVDSVTGRIIKPGATGVGSTAWGEATAANGNGADSEGKNTRASGAGAHAEGQDTDATATCAHSEGLGTKAQNLAEHAQGQYNASHTGSTNSEKTLHSIGIGTADNARKNAVEVMQDGKVFVNGVGGYDGTNPASSVDVATAVEDKLDKSDAEPLLFAQYYPDGSVKSAAEFTAGIKYDAPDTINRTITVRSFCFTGDPANDNSSLVGRVVIPPFVDAQGNPYISDDGTRFKVVGVSGFSGLVNTNTNPTAIVAPNTVTNIGSDAFDNCTALASVSLPSATNIGDYAFYNCDSLTSVSLPSATSIGNFAFYKCDSLTSVSLPSATSIGNGAFKNCTALTTVSLPAAQSIGNSAFYNCDSLTSVSLPSATSIGDFAFYNCDSLTSVSLPSATSIGDGAFYNCTALTTVSLPAAQSIGNSAFARCAALASVSLPSAKSIGSSAFASCPSLTTVDFGDTPRLSVPSLGAYAFDDVPTSCKIIVPDAQYDAWIAASGWSDLVTAGYEFLKHSEWEYARRYELAAKLDRMESISWSDLKAKRDNGALVPGQQYRITDYVATTSGDMDSRSANHPFDIIVTADSANELNEAARAIQHEGDTYFAGCDLAAWELMYCLDNDTTRFAWAVADGQTDAVTGTGGRGVVYRMVDEFDNDFPYDFKGIQFQRWAITEITSTKLTADAVSSLSAQFVYSQNGNKCFAYRNSNISVNGTVMAVDANTSAWYFTFDKGNGEDNSKNGYADNVYGNKAEEYVVTAKTRLNNIVFLGNGCNSNTFGNSCNSNTFGDGCDSNTFGSYCNSNTFGSYCNSNTFGSYCYSNTFGSYCYSNTFGDSCNSNTFGNSCYSNTFGDGCGSNTFGDSCNYNTFGDGCGSNTFGNGCGSNTFGNDCGSNTFGNGCGSNTFGNGCGSNTFGDGTTVCSYYKYITFENGVEYVNLNCTNTTDSAYYKNVTLKSGIVGSESNPKVITDTNVNQDFHTTYKPADSQEISVP